VPATLYVVVAGGAPLAGLLAVVSAIGAWEFFRIARASGLTPLDDVGIAIAGLIPLAVHATFQGLQFPAVVLAAVVFVGTLGLTIWRRGVEGKPLGAAATTIFGALYVGGMLSFGYALRYHSYAFADAVIPLGGQQSSENPMLETIVVPSGALLLMLSLLTTWASDIGAYAVGRTIGRHKLIPAVSPAKTVEGAVGGLIASIVVAWAFANGVLRPAAQLGFKWYPWGLILFGALVSVAAQVGDLAESLLKREAGVKDSSRIIPGHGGILDRLDSLFFVLPVSYLLTGWLLTWAPR
jgi:phosphatidate cytidylyltransferase